MGGLNSYDPAAPGRCVKLLAKEHLYKLVAPSGKPGKRKGVPEDTEEKDKPEPKAKAKSKAKGKKPKKDEDNK